jgi:hypothetical protein
MPWDVLVADYTSCYHGIPWGVLSHGACDVLLSQFLTENVSYRQQKETDMNQTERMKLRAIGARKLFDTEIHEEMMKIVFKIKDNAKLRKSKARRTRFEQLWAERAMLEHIADNDREDVSADDALMFYEKAVLFIGKCLNSGQASESAITIHNDL